MLAAGLKLNITYLTEAYIVKEKVCYVILSQFACIMEVLKATSTVLHFLTVNTERHFTTKPKTHFGVTKVVK
jgi:hypothetical protein